LAKCHLLSPPPPSIQNREQGGAARLGRRGACRRPCAHRRPRNGGKERGGRGDTIPVLTLSWGGAWERIGGGQWRGSGARGRRRCGARGRGERLLCVCGGEVRRPGEPSAPFYRRRRMVREGEIFPPASSTPVTSSGFSRRRPVTEQLGQRRQVNLCRGGGGAADRTRRAEVQATRSTRAAVGWTRRLGQAH
jgi:hypothetical protein